MRMGAVAKEMGLIDKHSPRGCAVAARCDRIQVGESCQAEL
jgi:hypothetical protein